MTWMRPSCSGGDDELRAPGQAVCERWADAFAVHPRSSKRRALQERRTLCPSLPSIQSRNSARGNDRDYHVFADESIVESTSSRSDQSLDLRVVVGNRPSGRQEASLEVDQKECSTSPVRSESAPPRALSHCASRHSSCRRWALLGGCTRAVSNEWLASS